MQFLTLQITLNYGLLRFNYSILIPYRMTACTRARKSTADYWLTSLCRLLCTFLARDLKMASKEIQDVSDSDGKGENYQRALTFWMKRWISWGHHACLLVIHSFIAWRTSHTPTTSMMFGISPSGWSKNLQSQTKGLWELAPWIQSISNRLWWCEGNQRWECAASAWKVEVLDHVGNKHKWSGNTLFHQCCHRCISSSEAKQICWLKPGSQAHIALEEVVLNKKLLKDLAKLTDFCHTGKIEVYHSMMLKYASKREHYSYQGMVARTQLAALDNNANTGRSQAVIKSGERAGEARYKLCFPKANKRWVVKPINEKKSYQFLSDLLSEVLSRNLGN